MRTLPQKTFEQLVSDMVTTWAVQMGLQPVFQSGDPLLGIMQSVSAQLVFIQAQIQLVNSIARAQTSTGADLDTFYGQFNFIRLPGNTPAGAETFGRNMAAATQVLVQPGTIVQTPGGAIQYQVVADPTRTAWDPSLGAYVLAPSATSIVVSIESLVPGSASNVSAGQLSQMGTTVPGIDHVTNSSPISSGSPPESDTSYSARFILYLASLSKATYSAIVEAIESVQTGVEFNLLENVDTNNNPRLGEFVAVIDDGTGSPPGDFIAREQIAIDAVRGFTILAEAKAVTKTTVTIGITIRILPGYITGTVEAAVQTAVAAVVNAVPIGQNLPVSTVEGAALGVAGVFSVRPGTTLNAVNDDLTITAMAAARTDTGHITVSTY